jgi:hypothetical protein
MKRVVVFVGAAAAAAALVAGASAGGESTAAGAHLTSTSSIQRHLAKLGIDSRTVVIQRGARNYAGPRCPGKGWTCTKSSRVVQISSHRGRNSFECSPAGSGTNSATNTCVIVQASSAGTNDAKCRMRDEGTTVAQSCTISQVNQTGANRATVELKARLRGGSAQDGLQTVSVGQTNASGRNVLRSEQRIDSVVKHFGATQTQEGHQSLIAEQLATTGNNDARVEQLQSLFAKAYARNGVVQRQNAVDGAPNLLADISQISTSGRNSSGLKQRARFKALAKSRSGPVDQRQGAPTGGAKGTVDQSSTGPSTSRNSQREDMKLRARTDGTLTQVQFGPMECCTEQLGNADNRFVIDQRSKLASDGGSQSSRITGSCVTSGRCNVDQSQRTDDERKRNRQSCTGSVAFPCSVFTQILCFAGEGCVVDEGGGEGRPSRPSKAVSARR